MVAAIVGGTGLIGVGGSAFWLILHIVKEKRQCLAPIIPVMAPPPSLHLTTSAIPWFARPTVAAMPWQKRPKSFPSVPATRSF
jgi:hypothetical protein